MFLAIICGALIGILHIIEIIYKLILKIGRALFSLIKEILSIGDILLLILFFIPKIINILGQK